MAVSLFCGLHFSLETFREEQRIRRVGKRLAIVLPLAVWTEKFSDWWVLWVWLSVPSPRCSFNVPGLT